MPKLIERDEFTREKKKKEEAKSIALKIRSQTNDRLPKQSFKEKEKANLRAIDALISKKASYSWREK